jgi:hypothetical protein
MKKFIVLSLSCFLILAFSAVGYSQEKAPSLDFKASGLIYNFSVLRQNVPTGPGNLSGATYGTIADYAYGGVALDKNEGFMQTRLRLRFDANMGKEITGTILFEADSTKWGERVGTGAQNNLMGQWQADRTALEIKNMFVAFGVPFIPVPTTMQVGILGNAIRPGMFLSSDGPAIAATIKADPATIKLMWAKPLENRIYNSDDVDLYGADVNTKIEDITVGGYAAYYNFNTYPLQDDTSSSQYKADFWWFGLYADGKAGPVNINLDLVFDKGTVEDRVNRTYEDAKYRGWATRAKIDYPWEQFNFGVVGMYAPGSNTEKTSATGLPAATSTKVSSYVTPPGSEMGYADSLCFYGAGMNWHTTGYFFAGNSVSRGDYGGTWFAKLYGSYKATPWYKITLEAIYIGDTTKNGNTIGNAVKSDLTRRDDKRIGFEFDLYNSFMIYKNLTWDIGAGILYAGDAMDYQVTGTNTNKSPKDPWIVTTNLTYVF